MLLDILKVGLSPFLRVYHVLFPNKQTTSTSNPSHFTTHQTSHDSADDLDPSKYASELASL